MKYLILGHKNHGKTTAAEILRDQFGFKFQDTTNHVLQIAKEYVRNNVVYVPKTLVDKYITMNTILLTESISNPGNVRLDKHLLLRLYHEEKDTIRDVLYDAICDYNKNDKSRFIKEVLVTSDIYAGCRSLEEYEASRHLFNRVFYIKDCRKPEDDPTMGIAYNPHQMVGIDNSRTIAHLERNIKQMLTFDMRTPVTAMDTTYRDYLVSALNFTPFSP